MRFLFTSLLGLSLFAHAQAAPALQGVRTLADLDYAGTDNPRQKLDLYLPVERKSDDPLPVIVFIHGGGWQAGDKRAAGPRLAKFVRTGEFAAVSIGYRLTDEASWPAQIHDCKAGVRWIRANAEKHGLDPDRILAFGPSAGGHLVAMLGVSGGDESLEGNLGPHLEESSAVSAVIDFFGPADFFTMADQASAIRHDTAKSPEGRLLGGAPKDVREVARNASPRHHVTGDEPPFLVVHGDRDRIVPYSQSADFVETLRNKGGDVAFLTVEGGGHGQGFGPAVEKVVTAFAEKHLLGKGREIKDATVKAGE